MSSVLFTYIHHTSYRKNHSRYQTEVCHELYKYKVLITIILAFMPFIVPLAAAPHFTIPNQGMLVCFWVS